MILNMRRKLRSTLEWFSSSLSSGLKSLNLPVTDLWRFTADSLRHFGTLNFSRLTLIFAVCRLSRVQTLYQILANSNHTRLIYWRFSKSVRPYFNCSTEDVDYCRQLDFETIANESNWVKNWGQISNFFWRVKFRGGVREMSKWILRVQSRTEAVLLMGHFCTAIWPSRRLELGV